jgi:hypothetical protein
VKPRFSPGEMKVLLEELALEFARLAEGATRAYQGAYSSFLICGICFRSMFSILQTPH